MIYRFYHLEKSIERINQTVKGPKIEFNNKRRQVAEMITEIAEVFSQPPITAVTDSWFGNNGLWQPMRDQLGKRSHKISRLRSNNNFFQIPPSQKSKKGPGRSRKYGKKLGDAASLAAEFRSLTRKTNVKLYGRNRAVLAHCQVVMLKTLKCAVRIVGVFRKTQWVALLSTYLRAKFSQEVKDRFMNDFQCCGTIRPSMN